MEGRNSPRSPKPHAPKMEFDVIGMKVTEAKLAREAELCYGTSL